MGDIYILDVMDITIVNDDNGKSYFHQIMPLKNLFYQTKLI